MSFNFIIIEPVIFVYSEASDKTEVEDVHIERLETQCMYYSNTLDGEILVLKIIFDLMANIENETGV